MNIDNQLSIVNTLYFMSKKKNKLFSDSVLS